MPGRVVAVAVELDRQLVRRPAAVDVAAADIAIGLRKVETVLPAEIDEGALEPAQGDRLAAHDCPQLPGAFAVRPAGEHGLDVLGLGAVEDARLVESLPELVLGERGGEI